MKNKILLTISLICIIFASFTKIKNKETKNTTDLKNYVIDTKNSSVSWKGYKLFKSNLTAHYGISNLKEGSLIIDLKKLTLISGKAVVDMATFESQDLNDKPDMKANLDSHLKSADFLDTSKYSTATFEVISFKRIESEKNNVLINGKLTLKGITKSIYFKALATGNKDKIILNSEKFDINRQDFGVIYKGSGESLINDNVTLEIKLVAIPSN